MAGLIRIDPAMMRLLSDNLARMPRAFAPLDRQSSPYRSIEKCAGAG